MALTPPQGPPGGHFIAQAPRLLRWRPWRHLPRDTRDTLFLLFVIAWTVLPHLSHLPLWCSLLTATVLLWRARVALVNALLPSRWVLVAVLALAAGLTLWSHKTLLGKEAGVTMTITYVGREATMADNGLASSVSNCRSRAAPIGASRPR